MSNMSDVKQFKSVQLNHAKPIIEQIHSNLRHRRQIQSELLQLDKIQSHLPTKLQHLFLSMPHHKTILADLTTLNKEFLPVLDYLVCFKSELGQLLQRLVESYNMILLDQFEGYYKNENTLKIELE